MATSKKIASTSPAPDASAVEAATASMREAFWKNPADANALRVWADALLEAGDPRGELIQLSTLEQPSEAQLARREILLNKGVSKLVGPAKPFLRTYVFGRNGLISHITTEAPNVIAGFELISQLNPLLDVTITSLKKKQFHAALAKLPLRIFRSVSFAHNGMNDDWFAAIAPALNGVKCLNLQSNDVTGAGLARAAAHLESLECLALQSQSRWETNALDPVALVNGWVDALCEVPALKRLKMVNLGGTRPDQAHLEKLKALTHLESVTYFYQVYFPPKGNAFEQVV